MAKITINGNFNFDSDIDDSLAAEVIKMVIERRYSPKTDKQPATRKRHLQAVEQPEQPEDCEPP
jgi:hypothetical protein